MPKGLNDDEDEQEGMVPVTLPSGALFYVHETEFQYFKDRARQYMDDNDFTNISDKQDIDRLLSAETLVHRWQLWLSMQRDYWGQPIDENWIQRAVKDHSAELRQLKKTMGLDRETREKVRGENSVDNFIAQLRNRARHFGYMRNEQAAKAIELLMEIVALVQLHDNCNEKERIELNVTYEEIFRWLREEAFPKFEEIDQKFRATEQRMWIRSQ